MKLHNNQLALIRHLILLNIMAYADCLTIPEPLPGLKELTGTVEDHWSRMIHEAIARQSKTHNSKSCDSYFLTKSTAG